MRLPTELGPIHFVGIGGIGMSGIAEVLLNIGYTVQGSDASENANVIRLRDKGATVYVGHEAAHLGQAEVVDRLAPRSSATIPNSRPRASAACLSCGAPEMLAELMRLKHCVAIGGTHGKTTTTSLVATLLDAGKFDPTVINGGIINAYGTNARLGGGDWMVVEADESDGTFLKTAGRRCGRDPISTPSISIISEHSTRSNMRFALLSENIPFYGFAVMCLDHPTVQELVGRIEDRRVITYGETPQADVRLVDVDLTGGISRFSVVIRDRKTNSQTRLDDLVMPMPGLHNALNATAALAVAHELGMSAEAIRTGLGNFGGVKRRFTRTGDWNGMTIFDDYGHHPVEIAAVLKAARASTKRTGHRRRAAAPLFKAAILVQ